MIVLLGDRYGWIPDESLIADAMERAGHGEDSPGAGRPGAERYSAGNRIRRFVESGSAEAHIVLFPQDQRLCAEACRPEDRHHAEKLKQLKERIIRLAGGQVREYCLTWNGEMDEPDGLDDFAAMVERDICAQMQHDWEETAG